MKDRVLQRIEFAKAGFSAQPRAKGKARDATPAEERLILEWLERMESKSNRKKKR